MASRAIPGFRSAAGRSPIAETPWVCPSPLRPGSLCYVYVYLGYIQDRATNREQAVSWYHKASGIMEADQ